MPESRPFCAEIIDDIEDLISVQDVVPKERYASRKRIKIRAKQHTAPPPPVPTVQNANLPGTECIYIKTWGCAHNSSDSEYMAGLLSAYGYHLTDDKNAAHLWLLNSCTVKSPSEDHFRNEVQTARNCGKFVVLAGCVPQAAPRTEFMRGLSIIGVQQIDRIVEVVEETLKGNSVRFLKAKKSQPGPSLLLPKIRRNPLIEIIPINTGCLNQCTYCKTKHSRGDLGSYPPHEILERARQAFGEGVVEVWLTSEDTGTYGRDIGTSLPALLRQLVEVVPSGGRLRLGMTNPPYILEHLDEMSAILQHPRVYRFLHLPVQSGSDEVLAEMKREYCRADFETICDTLRMRIPGITIATDIICGFPTETDEDFRQTLDLCEKYRFPSLFINQFYPRPGTPAAKMPRTATTSEVKTRTKRLTDLFHSYRPYTRKYGQFQRVLVTEVSHDRKHYVGHNEYYEQVLVPMEPMYMGKLVDVRIVECNGKFSMVGEPISITDVAVQMKKPIIHNGIENLRFGSHVVPICMVFFALLANTLWSFFAS